METGPNLKVRNCGRTIGSKEENIQDIEKVAFSSHRQKICAVFEEVPTSIPGGHFLTPPPLSKQVLFRC